MKRWIQESYFHVRRLQLKRGHSHLSDHSGSGWYFGLRRRPCLNYLNNKENTQRLISLAAMGFTHCKMDRWLTKQLNPFAVKWDEELQFKRQKIRANSRKEFPYSRCFSREIYPTTYETRHVLRLEQFFLTMFGNCKFLQFPYLLHRHHGDVHKASNFWTDPSPPSWQVSLGNSRLVSSRDPSPERN